MTESEAKSFWSDLAKSDLPKAIALTKSAPQVATKWHRSGNPGSYGECMVRHNAKNTERELARVNIGPAYLYDRAKDPEKAMAEKDKELRAWGTLLEDDVK